ncbi:MAG: hypothetical protein IPK07_03140 [Deltaproteobacteria bacterium]|nr:hypothetical protein [Deltaproteobacteria bacterium]
MCVYRVWFTAKLAWLGRVRIYVDDLERPVVDEAFLELFEASARRSSRHWCWEPRGRAVAS